MINFIYSRCIHILLTPQENPSGGLKRNGQNPDTMEAKTVKTKIKTEFGKKWVKSAISWHNFERL